MNSDVVNQIDALLGAEAAPEDRRGALALLAGLLQSARPIAIWLTDQHEGIVAAHAMDDAALPDLSAVSDRLRHRLTDRCNALIAEDACGSVFAVALPASAGAAGMLAGLLAADRREAAPLFEAQLAALRCGAALAWIAVHAAREADDCNVRMRQLEHERDTLRQSYTQIMTSAIEEREQRLREQQRYTEQLEEEVARRSADLREALKEAKLASKAKSEFLANMSHELRTPLTAILGYADLMLDPGQAPAQRSDCIQTIHRNGRHLLSIINDILDLSKIEAGRMTTEIIECSPVEIVHDIAGMMRMRAVEKGLDFACEFKGKIPATIHSDPTRIRQMLVNLVGNAIKFTHEGSVRIVTRMEQRKRNDAPQRLRFEVIDTGIGMTPQQQKQMFLPFSQADNSTTRKYGGTGLGLAICKRLTEMLGGDINCTSKRNRGSRFAFSVDAGILDGVPWRNGEDIQCDQAAPASQPADIRLRGRILLAEDGPDNQRLLKFLLCKAGAQVDVAENGRIAVEKAMYASHGQRAGDRPYDLILMDMQMPELDGYGATAELRQKGYQGPIVALTAHAMAGDRERCLAAGCDDYTTKPIDRVKLLTTLAEHLNRASTQGSAT